MPDTTDARIERSRTRLKQALERLLEARPLEEISIRDIAGSADVGYTTFFRHYPSKEALLTDIATEEIERLCELTIPVYDTADLHAACLALSAYVDEHRSLWSALLTGSAASHVREELLRRARMDTASRQIAHAWMPADLSVHLAVTVMVEILTWWLRQSDPWPVAKVADILLRAAVAPAEAGATNKRRSRANS